MTELNPEVNVLGGTLEPCGTDPVTGFYRDDSCRCGSDGIGLHAMGAVMTPEFLKHQRSVGNDLSTARPEWGFPGLPPGRPLCVAAGRWLQAHGAGGAAPVVLASTNARVLEIVPIELLTAASVDVPPDLSSLD